MKSIKYSLLPGLAILACLVGQGAAQADRPTFDRADLLSSFCITCHGQNGKGANKVPRLKTLTVDDIEQAMFGFQTGEWRSTIMGRIAEGFTEEEITLMARYFAAIPE